MENTIQMALVDFDSIDMGRNQFSPPVGQLLKWIGNKQRFAPEIISFFPKNFGTYIEPFLGSGAVLATLAPEKAIAADNYTPLIKIFVTLQSNPNILIEWYTERWTRFINGDRKQIYEEIKAEFNKNPNPADLIFLTRSCYGGVIRFRKSDGYISTPVGIHKPISPESFSKRVLDWHKRTVNAKFHNCEFEKTMSLAKPGDLIYCDPPYSFSQPILYGAQEFDLNNLLDMITFCKKKGIYVALSIDGTKKSGEEICNLPLPKGLFEQEIFIKVGRSMLKRFQMSGQNLSQEIVNDRLLLTY